MEALSGTPIRTVAAGIVATVSGSPRGGKYVIVVHGEGKLTGKGGWPNTRYRHMKRHADGLKSGQQVKRGQVIGYVGQTGYAISSSPHLHFELAIPPGKDYYHAWAKPIDPAPYWIRDKNGKISPMSRSVDYGETAIKDGKLPNFTVGFTNPLCDPVS